MTNSKRQWNWQRLLKFIAVCPDFTFLLHITALLLLRIKKTIHWSTLTRFRSSRDVSPGSLTKHHGLRKNNRIITLYLYQISVHLRQQSRTADIRCSSTFVTGREVYRSSLWGGGSTLRNGKRETWTCVSSTCTINELLTSEMYHATWTWFVSWLLGSLVRCSNTAHVLF